MTSYHSLPAEMNMSLFICPLGFEGNLSLLGIWAYFSPGGEDANGR